MQHFLYFFPLPQGQGSLRPGEFIRYSNMKAGKDRDCEVLILQPERALQTSVSCDPLYP